MSAVTLTNNEVLTHNDVTLGLQISEMAAAVELVTQIFADYFWAEKPNVMKIYEAGLQEKQHYEKAAVTVQFVSFSGTSLLIQVFFSHSSSWTTVNLVAGGVLPPTPPLQHE